jgi:uncharacterized membrane protein YhiD involved in acid resistance
MNWVDFGIRLLAALLFGGVIGLERQWRQRMTGLRTNGLVAVGSAMFIMMGGLIGGEGSQGRVAAYVVSGIGFLGGGVILKDGFNIRGLNTAATLWCTAAVKSLGPKEESLEQIVTRLSLESGVTAISWEIVAAVDAEDASITSSDELIQATS